jgi:hypothetical protein
MKRFWFLIPVFTALSALVVCASGFGQEAADQPAQPVLSSQPAPQKHVPVLGNADEFAFTTDVSYYIPQDRVNRDIDLQVAAIAAVAHMRHGWEFQFNGMALRAQGYRSVTLGVPTPQIPSDAAGLAVGPVARWNFFAIQPRSPFRRSWRRFHSLRPNVARPWHH